MAYNNLTDGGDGMRTSKQNSSLHLYLRRLSEALNESGLDMKTVLKPGVDIPWSSDGTNAKNFLWKPIQKAMLDKDSTTDLTTKEITEVYECLNRHMAEKFGVSIPFPSKDEQ